MGCRFFFESLSPFFMKSPVIIISAMTQERVIGIGDSLPWHIPQEYEMFLSYIKGQTAIIGRKSFEIFKKGMFPKRIMVVSKTMTTDHAKQVYLSFNEAVLAASKYSEKIFILGGSGIYKEAIEIADEMYLSFIKKSYSGSVYFPEIDWSKWKLIHEKDFTDFVFRKYKRA